MRHVPSIGIHQGPGAMWTSRSPRPSWPRTTHYDGGPSHERSRALALAKGAVEKASRS